MLALLLVLFGLMFVLLEFYLPGAIMGVIGAILLMGAVAVFAQYSQSFTASILFLLGEAFLLYLLVKCVLRCIPRSKNDFNIYLSKDQEGYVASHFDKEAIGRIGKVISDLKPGGYVLIDGKKQQAISQSGYIAEGHYVLVIGGEGESLTVKEINQSNEENLS